MKKSFAKFSGNVYYGRIDCLLWMEGFIEYIFKIFLKTNISFPLIRMCAYQGVRNISFRKTLRKY